MKFIQKKILYIDSLGIWIMNVSIGNWGANQLTYEILGKLIEILKKTNNKLHRTSCGNLATSLNDKAEHKPKLN